MTADKLPPCPLCGCLPEPYGDGICVWCGGLDGESRSNACPLRREDSCFTPDEWRRLAGWAKQKARAEKAERERDEARREINDAWLMIENGWDDNIESRAEWEKRYRKNFNDGGSGPLGMAIHAAGYKRETKAEARAEKLAAALREIQEGKGPFDRDNHKFACNVIESMKAIAALALADGEEK